MAKSWKHYLTRTNVEKPSPRYTRVTVDKWGVDWYCTETTLWWTVQAFSDYRDAVRLHKDICVAGYSYPLRIKNYRMRHYSEDFQS